MDTDTQVKQDIAQLRVNGSRLWDSLMELAQIGATPKGGVCRLTLTDLDRQGRDLVTRWAREAGMTVTRSEEHTSELQSQSNLVCRLLLEKKKRKEPITVTSNI